ncbi:SDR family NAD(P)-dependent oxidoreductase [Vannielia litorea]|uniref:SDR family NAD(P)-dependent oxidoreductase n=1 Tax=Vannielia litorea TaxID=1217970 RepID=UPI001BD0BBD3|nr:SDR family oxidoreductase [Vannielia litorea]MBS8226304.1 SDR family NAD(P)-dependent oxidoreductase [Vannielia litorea]
MKGAIVTGAARGIGLATARLLAGDGWKVAMVDRDSEALEAAVGEVPGGVAVFADVSVPEDASRMITEAKQALGRIDGLVNNAGVALFGPVADTDFAMWREVMATNLDGVFLCSQAAREALFETKGAVVNIASISGHRASTLRVAYGTSKAGVIHLTKQFAAEWGEHGVRVNCVAPGPVDTKLALAVHTPDIRAAYHDAIPLNRYGKEEEIAQGIVFLLSEKASYITGQLLSVDGGFESTGIGLPSLRP